MVKVRRAEEGDIEGLLAIERSCFGRERFNRRMLLALLAADNVESYLGIEENKVMASAFLLLDSARTRSRILSLAVLPERRGLGHGRELLLHLEERARNGGSTLITLEVRVTNVQAINMYLHHDYSIEGTIRHYFGKGQDAIYMEKRLVESS